MGTFVIDVYNRVIPGFVLLLEAPERCPSDYVWDTRSSQEAWLASRGIAASWPIWGTPR